MNSFCTDTLPFTWLVVGYSKYTAKIRVHGIQNVFEKHY